MTSKGSLFSRFHRALDAGQAQAAFALACDLSSVSLEDALRLCLVLDVVGRVGPALAGGEDDRQLARRPAGLAVAQARERAEQLRDLERDPFVGMGDVIPVVS